MFVILINDDNTMNATQKQRIVQKSKLVDDFYFLVKPEYNGHDMTNATVLLEYLKPVSREYETEFLTLAKDKYKDYLKYILPVDTNFTKEAGELEIQVSFIYVDNNDNGDLVQRVRKTAPVYKIKIEPIAAWSDIIPDGALTAIDQRILKQDAQIKALAELANAFDGEMVDNLEYNKNEETLQLTANGVGIGNKVSLKDMVRDGVPIIDFGSGSNSGSDDDSNADEEDNVVEF